MKEVALPDAARRLASLIDEVKESGEEIIITRQGKPAARLAPLKPRSTPESRAALGARLLAHLDKLAREHPESLAPISWEELKAEIDEDRC